MSKVHCQISQSDMSIEKHKLSLCNSNIFCWASPWSIIGQPAEVPEHARIFLARNFIEDFL